ncbi:MAG: glucose 6-phosphate dehydrogenase, partial [Cyanobacteria bacterium K_Offshore_0m_m2_072]|nr:glucose 6-phosphate dehydrogenase [Cyanobacteria bacterium K_Offshore_0m_m2_072]
MAAQLTLQSPLALPPTEVRSYLERLWSTDLEGSKGAATFTLVIYEASWLQQQLIRTGLIDGPITGLLERPLIEQAKQAVVA